MFEELLKELPRDDVRLIPREHRSDIEWPRALSDFWDECDSGYYGGLALHVFGTGYEESFHDIEKWNNALSFFRWLVPQHYIAFGEDPFGNQFFYDSTKNESPVYGLLLQDAVMVTMANAIDEFLVKLLDERLRDAILNYSFYIDCLTNGVDHKAGHHLTLKVPRVLGGNEKMGIVDVEAITNVSYLGQLIEQTKDLSPEERASRVRFSTE